MELAELAKSIQAKAAGAGRFMAGIAGAPGSGKSTLAENLMKALAALGERAIVVPMDGFHFDDAVLNARGHRARKGAPYTFDVAGLEALLRRIRAGEPEIAIPVFDRTMELSRAGAAIVDAGARFILVEGNYLLLKRAPWDRLRGLFDFTVFLDVPRGELDRRLVRRWLDLGFDAAHARNWIDSNDMPNIEEVTGNSAEADVTI